MAWQSPPTVARGTWVLLRPRRPARIHLGCGDRYLRGYLNIDLPPAQGMVSARRRPDVEADVRWLICPSESLAEIRLHHVFEHFERAEALALLVRWHEWLVPGGQLVLETPDFERCIEGFSTRTMAQQARILRHLFGSQEAPWAQHRDGWSSSRFRTVLSELGFDRIVADKGCSDADGLLVNAIVTAKKPVQAPSWEERVARASRLLELSMNGTSESEQVLLGRWRDALTRALGPVPENKR